MRKAVGNISETEPLKLRSRSPRQTQLLGRQIGKLAQRGDILLFTGNLGTGKTCLIQGIAYGLGIKEHPFSPSFVIVREYHGRLHLYHIDFYRLDHVEEIESPRLIYEENTARLFRSILVMLYRTIASTPFSFFKVRKIIKDFKPDILISDADPISHHAAHLSGIKRISIDNPQVMLHRKYKVKIKEFFSWFTLLIAIKISALGADKYIIYDFFDEQVEDQRVLFLKPLIQEGILNKKPTYGNHVFVYQTSISHEYLFQVLKKIDETFIIYLTKIWLMEI